MMCFDPISYDKAEKAMKHSKNVQEQLINAVEYNVTNAIRNAELTEKRDWIATGCTYTASNGVATLTSTGDVSTMRFLEKTPLTTAKKGDKFYLKVTVTAKSDGLSEMYLYFRDWTAGGTYARFFTLNPTKNYVNNISAIAEVDRDFVGEPMFYVTAATGSVAGLVLEITEPMMVNLTETFGAGNEPTTKEEFESLITKSNGKVFFAKKHNLFNAKKIVDSLRKIEQNQTRVVNNNFHIPKIVRRKRKLWTISYDDESSTIFNYAFPVHKAEDVPAIFYVIPSRIGTGMSYGHGIATTWDELREMEDWGFEIGNHTYSNNNTSYMDELTLIDNIKRSQEVFYLNGIYPVHFAHPGGSSTMNNSTVLQDYFLTAALTGGGVNDYDLNPFRLKRRSSDAYYNSFFDALDTLAASDGGWIITYHHAVHPDGVIEGNQCWTPTQLQTAIQYAKSLGIEVVSLTEGYETYAPFIYYFNEDVQPIYSVQRNGIIVNNPIP